MALREFDIGFDIALDFDLVLNWNLEFGSRAEQTGPHASNATARTGAKMSIGAGPGWDQTGRANTGYIPNMAYP